MLSYHISLCQDGGVHRPAVTSPGLTQANGVHSAKSDWSRRILDFAYMDYDDQAAHHE